MKALLGIQAAGPRDPFERQRMIMKQIKAAGPKTERECVFIVGHGMAGTGREHFIATSN